ncbi:MAG: hypothetical protein ABUT39_00785 [Acidobacteriota bacterium]
MIIDIFDVGHGSCNLITCPNGTRVLIDCGFSLGPPWFPSLALKGTRIDLLALLNLDEDHVGDLAYQSSGGYARNHGGQAGTVLDTSDTWAGLLN